MSHFFLKRIGQLLLSKKDDFYDEDVYAKDDTISYYSSSRIYSAIKSELKPKNPKISLKPISPLGKSNFDNVTLSEISNNFGNIKHRLNVTLGERQLKIYVFKNIYGGFKTTVSAHFYNKELFNLRYEFIVNDIYDCSEIINLISLKYLNGQPIDIKNEYLVDEHNTVLSFSNEIDLVLDYHNNSDIFSYMNFLLEADEAQKQDEIYNRYKKLYTKL